MRFIKYVSIVLLTTLVAIVISCKNEVDADLMSNEWEVQKIKEPDDADFRNAEESYILRFEGFANFTINLDINTCFGSHNIPTIEEIDFSYIGCTEACCDSEFAEDLIRILEEVDRFEISGDELRLFGAGEILLNRI